MKTKEYIEIERVDFLRFFGALFRIPLGGMLFYAGHKLIFSQMPIIGLVVDLIGFAMFMSALYHIVTSFEEKIKVRIEIQREKEKGTT